jgi:hypothetical protein
MGKIKNEELVQKAVITADALASTGKLNPAQEEKFLDYVFDETVLSQSARVARFSNEKMYVEKIGIGKRAAMPKEEAVDPGLRRGVTTSRVTFQPKEVMVPVEIGDIFSEINVEGKSVEDHVIRMFANQLANDLEELYILGNTLGPASVEGDIVDGGSTTQYIKDSYLALLNGWQYLAESGNQVDAAGANIGLSVFGSAIRAMPTKFRRNKGDLRFFCSPDLAHLYYEKTATRASNLGDAAAGGATVNPFGIPIVEVPIWDLQPLYVEHVTLNGTTAVSLKNAPVSDVVVLPSTLAKYPPQTPYVSGTDYTLDASAGTIARDAGGSIGDGDVVKVTYKANPKLILTHKSNFIIAVGRDVRIERGRDIFKGVNQYAITVKADANFEEASAIVNVKNIGTGV